MVLQAYWIFNSLVESHIWRFICCNSCCRKQKKLCTTLVEGHICKLICCNSCSWKEGTKIQATLFGMLTEKWKSTLEVSKVYYVINGRIKPARVPKYNCNKYKELTITQSTELSVCTSEFQTAEFSNGFASFNRIEQMDRKLYYDVVGILVESSGVQGTEALKRRVITICNDSYERVRVTLWNDHVDDGVACFESAEICKTIVALCNVKINEFKGTLGFVSIKLTSVLPNPRFKTAIQLDEWNKMKLKDGVDIRLTPSPLLQRSTEMTLANMLQRRHDKEENKWCKFNAIIQEVLDKDRLCYPACKRCRWHVESEGSTYYCDYCKEYQETHSYQYCLTLRLQFENQIQQDKDQSAGNKTPCNSVTQNEIVQKGTAGQENDGNNSAVREESDEFIYNRSTITVTLFEGAKYLLGCSAVDYMASIAKEGHQSNIINGCFYLKDKLTLFWSTTTRHFHQKRELVTW